MNETTELIMKQLNSKKVHAETHEVGGGDEIDVLKLKNAGSLVTKSGDFSGTWNGLTMTSTEPGLSTSFNALKADNTQRSINVRSAPYNANGNWNGTTGTDNLAAFNSAVNALPSTGGEIIIPDGDYWLSDSWNIDKDNITVKIMPGATVRTTNPTTGGHTLGFIGYYGLGVGSTPQRKNAKIYGGGYVRNTSSGTNENGIACVRYDGFTCDGMNIPEANRKAITCQDGADKITIVNNKIGISGNNAISIETNCNGIYIVNNVIDETLGNGIHVTGTCTNVNITDNTVKKCTGVGTGIYTATAVNVTVRNNIVTSCYKGIENITVTNLKIFGNTLKDIASNGIRAAVISDNLVVNENNISNCSLNVFYFDSCTVKPILIGNLIKGTTHQRAMNTVNMGSYLPVLTGNNFITGTVSLYDGWYPKFVHDVVDGVDYIIENGNRITYGSAIPTTGTWAFCDKVYNTSPTLGGYLGWICMGAGTPGTWRGFGLIQT